MSNGTIHQATKCNAPSSNSPAARLCNSRPDCAHDCTSIGQDPRRTFATSGNRVRTAIDAAAGARASRIDRPAICLGGSGRVLGLAPCGGGGDRRGSRSQRQFGRGTKRFSTLVDRDQLRSRRFDPGTRDESAGTVLQGLARAIGTVRDLSHAAGRCRRSVRSKPLQRSAVARFEGNDERSGIAHSQKPSATRNVEQGPARRSAQPCAARLRAHARRRLRDRSGRAGAVGRAIDLRAVRAPRQRQRAVAVAGAQRRQAAGSSALRRQSRRTRMAAAQPRDVAESVAPSDLRGGLSLGTSRSGPAQKSSRQAIDWPHVQCVRPVPRADPRPLPGLHRLGGIREKSAKTSGKQASCSPLPATDRACWPG